MSPSPTSPADGAATADGSGPRVLFVCVRNGGKSQMAAGLMRRAAAQQGLSVHASSAGTRAGQSLNAQSVASLAEVGVDIADQCTHQLTDDDVRGSGRRGRPRRRGAVEPVDGTPVEVWETVEPSTRGIEGMERMRLVRDDIATRVEELARRLRGTAGQTPAGAAGTSASPEPAA